MKSRQHEAAREAAREAACTVKIFHYLLDFSCQVLFCRLKESRINSLVCFHLLSFSCSFHCIGSGIVGNRTLEMEMRVAESRDRRQVFGPFAALAINHGTYFESKEKITWLSENTIDFLCTYLSQSSLVLY